MDLCPLVDAMSIIESSWTSKGPSTDPEFGAAVAASRIINYKDEAAVSSHANIWAVLITHIDSSMITGTS